MVGDEPMAERDVRFGRRKRILITGSNGERSCLRSVGSQAGASFWPVHTLFLALISGIAFMCINVIKEGHAF